VWRGILARFSGESWSAKMHSLCAPQNEAQQQPQEGQVEQQQQPQEGQQQQQQQPQEGQQQQLQEEQQPQEGQGQAEQQPQLQEKQHEDQRWEHRYQQGGQGEGGHCQGMEDCLPWSGEKRKGNDKTLLGFGIVNCEVVPKKS
jgi:hypothetical protein